MPRFSVQTVVYQGKFSCVEKNLVSCLCENLYAHYTHVSGLLKFLKTPKSDPLFSYWIIDLSNSRVLNKQTNVCSPSNFTPLKKKQSRSRSSWPVQAACVVDGRN